MTNVGEPRFFSNSLENIGKIRRDKLNGETV